MVVSSQPTSTQITSRPPPSFLPMSKKQVYDSSVATRRVLDLSITRVMYLFFVREAPVGYIVSES